MTLYSILAPKWPNWQTCTFGGRVRQPVGVRVPPSAPSLFSREKRAFAQKFRSVPPHLITQLLGFNPRPVAAALAESEAKTRRVRELQERIMPRRAQSKSPRLPSCGRVAG